MLTKGAEEITGTDNNDLFKAVVSSLSSEKTLDAKDVIDGGAGSDVMQADLKGSFAGLGTDGSIKNVENFELTNSTTIDRSFNAKNIEGAEKYTLITEKAISLSNLAAAGIEVNAEGAQNDYTIAFNSDLDLTGTTDAMTLGFSGVGAAEVKNSAGTVTTAQNNVAVTMASIDDLTIKTTGDANFVSLAAVDATSYTISGSSDLTISAVKDGITSIDASELNANFKIDTTGVAGADITSITSGSGDDEITIDADDLTPNASIDGGTGTDTLVVEDGSGNTVQYSMSNVETVEFENIGGAVTFSATNVSDLETVQVNGLAAGKAVSIVNLGSRDITVQTEGDTIAAQNVSVDNSGNATVNFNLTEKQQTDAKDATTNSTIEADGDVTLSNAASAIINVNDYAKVAATATVDAAKATDLTLNVASAKNSNTTPAEQTAFAGILKAAKATSATITAEGTLNLAATSDLSAVETLQLTTTGAATIANANLESAATVIVGGTNKDAALAMGYIGTDADGSYALAKAGAVDYSLSVEASGLKSGLTTGSIATQQNLTVDVSAVTGAIDLAHTTDAGPIIGSNVTITATEATKAMLIGDIDGVTADKGIATVNAAGAAKAVTIGTVGANSAFKTINVDASSSLDNVTVGNMIAADVTLNVGNTLGTITTGTITVDDSFTYTAGLEGASDVGGAGNAMIVNIAADTAAATDTTVTLNGDLGNDKFAITGGDNATKDATITVKGDLGIGTNDVAVTSGITGTGKATIDLSTLKGNGTTTTTSITGGTGDDTIKLNSDATIVDTVKFLAASNGTDTITGFGTQDILDLTAFVASTTETDIAAASAAGTNTLANANYFFITTDGSAASLTTGGTATLAAADYTAATLTNVAAYLSEQFTVAATADDNAVIVLNDTVSGNAYVYEFTEATPAAGGVVAAELALVGIVNDATVVAGDVA